MEIFSSLSEYPFIKHWEVVHFKQSSSSLHYKINLIFQDDSCLFVREFYSPNVRDYSFHWQDKHQVVLARWDNAPHFPSLTSFPHHKHNKELVEECKEMFLKDVLKEIELVF
jgi:hypothetical protein